MDIDVLQKKLNEIINEDDTISCAKKSRMLLQLAIEFLYEKSDSVIPKNASLLELIDSELIANYLNDKDLVGSLHYVRILGMNAEHGRNVRKKEAKLSADNISYFVEFIIAKETGNVVAYHKPPYMSEAATRRLYVDMYLREAGWDIVEKDNVALPMKAGVEIEVLGMPNGQGKGYCDYVLYGTDGKPLAIVEVKKTSLSPEKGRHQVDLYAECMKAVWGYKPVMYYTNGYTTRIIDGLYPDRDVIGFHSLKELEIMLQRRNRKPITDIKVNEDITDRPYQKMAITSICEWLNSNHRRGLLVMATGTGKTRVSISLVDILLKNNWVSRVLFLADRTALVNQAKRNFSRKMPDMSICELSGSGEKDLNARLMFSTYQTMINYIDAEDKAFTIGRFDLIIIDEAHRSIFNRYGSIFKYFDSFLVGLTATPKNEVDANTYRIFGCEAGIPNFDYSMEDAIQDKYLVGYHVVNRSSQIMTEGIDYNSLTDEQKRQFDDYMQEEVPDPDFVISGNEIFKYLFNKDTCRKVLEDLMKWGYRVDGGETLGKTIIFAYNHKHAQMIVECFQEMYPEFAANTCQLVDYSVDYGENLVVKFEEDPEFRIAVSVDMLDTGVDVPAVLNLVFFKKVRSKIKFIQMIGRGTRLCENLYGPGKDKSGFQIFDYCGNFEYFGEHPDGREGKEVITLSQRIFQLKLDMLYELQRIEFQEDDWYRAYYNSLKKDLHNQVILMKSHDSRTQIRESMQYVDKYYDLNTWAALSQVTVKEAKKHLSPLLDSGIGGNHYAVAFDARVYYIERDLLQNGVIATSQEHIKNIRIVAQYLLNEKASIPQVLEKAAHLKKVMSENFWNTTNVAELEAEREELRDIMKFLAGSGRPQINIDIPDNVDDSDYVPDDTNIDIRTYKEKVIDYLMEHSDRKVIQKIYYLEPVNNDDLMELEVIMWQELGTKEEYEQTTDIGNLAAFVRSLIGLSQEAVNEKFGEYLSGNVLNSQQQEFVRTIINYVRENGDIELSDMVNTEPFNNYDLNEIFGESLPTIITIVNMLHGSVVAA